MKKTLIDAVVDTMQDGLLMVDTGGIINAVNPSFETMTGYTSRELIGKRCTILNCSGCEVVGGREGRPWCAMFANGGVRNRRCSILTRQGTRVEALKSATVIHDAEGNVTGAVEVMKDVTESVRQREAIRHLRANLRVESGDYGILGSSDAVRRLKSLIEDVAQCDAPVLIHGESGVGKELVAQAMHDRGSRADGPFIKVNCSSLNENLLESELFGHVRGAFTGAGRDRVGRFEAATGGTIFLDEIGDISPALQVKLLRVLESREIERVGDHRTIRIDARVISATNRDLGHLVTQNAFRSDLFYRINVIPVHVPPLRERKEDIPVLARHFIDQIASRSEKRISGLASDALEALMAYEWPGNIRELRNVIEYAFVQCREGLIQLAHIENRLNASGLTPTASREPVGGTSLSSLIESRALARRERLLDALRQTRGNQSAAARILGVSRVTVWKQIRKFHLRQEEGSGR